jgi:shikimate dehydrogenase
MRRKISGTTKVVGIMGWPVRHSLSPSLHGAWLDRYGIDGVYVPLPVLPDALARALTALPALGLAGVNLTVPHKVAAVPLMASLSAEAERAGAVNTVVVGEDGALIGTNTDGFGFLASISEAVPSFSPAAGPATVIGAGGGARAVVAALLDHGATDVRVVNRTRARAEALAAALGGPVQVVGWAERADALADASLLVNTTTLGMKGQPPLELDLTALPASAIVVDIVYVPLLTPLLAAAAARGHIVVDGLGMLLHQARPSFKAWFGIDPEVTDDLRRAVAAGFADR